MFTIKNHYKSTLTAFLLSSVAVLNACTWQSLFVGLLVFVMLFGLYTTHTTRYLSSTLHPTERWLWACFLVLFVPSLVTTIGYYAVGIQLIPSSIILLLFPLFFLKKPPFHIAPLPVLQKESRIIWISIVVQLLTQIILLGTLFANRTSEVMVSTWHVVEPWFFLLYAAHIALLLFITKRAKNHWIALGLTCISIFIAFGVAAIVYILGFGFDGFIHRATQEWIISHGSITPKTPYYIGQYSLLAWIHHFTKVPLFLLDNYLVPLVSALFLPLAISGGIAHRFPKAKQYALWAVWLVPFLPFVTLNLTTPHNLVIFFGIVTIFTWLHAYDGKLPIAIPLLSTVFALITHPLLGVPLFLWSATIYFIKRFPNKHRIILFGTTLSTIFAPATMFGLNNYLAGAGFPSFQNVFTALPQFFSLFERPYWYAINTPWLYELIYGWELLIMPTVIVFAFIGYKKIAPPLRTIFLTGIISYLGAALVLRSWIYFPGVAETEQGNYPLRLIWMSAIFFLPFAYMGMVTVTQWIAHKYPTTKKLTPMVYTGIAGALMLSFYFSYPQRNIKARFPGYNVTKYDVAAVEYIHAQQDDYDYIVLANPLVGAAAMTQYSFAQYHDTAQGEVFYYSVPTGGPLYKFYGDMVYHGTKPQSMQEAMTFANVSTAYFVINSYWANYEHIVEIAKKTADAVHIIDDDIAIFTYKRTIDY